MSQALAGDALPEATVGSVFGFGLNSYRRGLDALLGHLDKSAALF